MTHLFHLVPGGFPMLRGVLVGSALVFMATPAHAAGGPIPIVSVSGPYDSAGQLITAPVFGQTVTMRMSWTALGGNQYPTGTLVCSQDGVVVFSVSFDVGTKVHARDAASFPVTLSGQSWTSGGADCVAQGYVHTGSQVQPSYTNEFVVAA